MRNRSDTLRPATFSVLGLAALCGVAVPTVAFAEKPSGAGSADGTFHEFQMMDTNGDGKISPDEHAAGARHMFDTMDANRDGRVTAAEMDAAHEQIAGRKEKRTDMSAADKIKAIDTNHDGVLSADEHAAGSQMMFEKMDTDKDGFLSRSELDAGHAKMMSTSKTLRK
jgi:Ca2+-binding EF-hand superfamily protein